MPYCIVSWCSREIDICVSDRNYIFQGTDYNLKKEKYALQEQY